MRKTEQTNDIEKQIDKEQRRFLFWIIVFVWAVGFVSGILITLSLNKIP